MRSQFKFEGRNRKMMFLQPQVCMYCEGTGIETQRVGHVLTRKTCSYCDGTRQFHKYKCNECEGTGQTVVALPFE